MKVIIKSNLSDLRVTYRTIEFKDKAINKLDGAIEITRFKGLGEISPGEFKEFIGDEMRLDPVILDRHKSESEMLQFYMGKNTPDRQKFIIDNLRVELDLLNEEEVA